MAQWLTGSPATIAIEELVAHGSGMHSGTGVASDDLLEAVQLAGQLAGVARADVGLEDEADARHRTSSTASQARRTTSMHSSHSPSTVVNMESVR